jgi:hypothetical protein
MQTELQLTKLKGQSAIPRARADPLLLERQAHVPASESATRGYTVHPPRPEHA